MIKNYLKTAWRSLLRSSLFTSIKVIGLVFGIIISIPIFLIIKDELSFDQFHEKKDKIYRAWVDEEYGDGVEYLSTVTPKVLGHALKQNIPEVQGYTRIESFREYIAHDNELFSERFTVADPDFFTIFDFKIIAGSSNGIFTNIHEAVINEEVASRFFGKEDPVGKTISVRLSEEFQDFKVVAVIENAPPNSSIDYGILIPYENMKKRVSENNMNSWFNISCETYVLINETSGLPSKATLDAMLSKELGEEYKPGSYEVGLQPLTSIHLDTSLPEGNAPVTDPKYIYILGAIALLVLLLGCINFTTLALGKSLSRTKEVGVRKVVGANRWQIQSQFLGESFLTTLIALVVSLSLLPLLLPAFNEISGRSLTLQPSPINIIFIIILLLVLALMSGSYPALILSRLKPALIVKGNAKAGFGKQRILRWLIGAQLVLSLFLITCMLIMKNQLNFLQERNLGFETAHIAVVGINKPSSMSMVESFEKSMLLKNELDGQTAIKAHSIAVQDFLGSDWISVSFPDAQGVTHGFSFNVISPEFIPMMNIDIIQGRNFTGWDGDNKSGIIINQAFAKYFGWEEPLGKSIPGPEFIDHQVIGVVKDFHYMSLHSTIEPLALVVNPMVIFSGIDNLMLSQGMSPKAFIQLHAGQVNNGLEVIKQGWEKVYPSEPFDFAFLDENIQRQYEAEQRLGKIVTGSASLAILISAMGLFGLSSLVISGRTKEIGIRRVLGAETGDITFMFTREFLLISLISLILAIPFSIFVMNDWLQAFQYRIDIDPWVFIITGFIAVIICLITVTTQSFKASLQNPVDSIGID